MSLRLHHIQSRPVISRKNSHSCCVRSFHPTLLTSTKVPVVNMFFAKITKRPASNHIFPKSPTISEALASSSPQPACPAVLFPVRVHLCLQLHTLQNGFPHGNGKHRPCLHLTFFPALLASCISRSQSGNSCKIKLRLLEWRQVSVFSTNHAAMPSFQSCTQTPLLTRACVHVLSCMWRDFIHQRSARTTD